jgi:hypothetical protein
MVVLKLFAFFWLCVAFIVLMLLLFIPPSDKDRKDTFLEEHIFLGIVAFSLLFAYIFNGAFPG